MKRFTILALLMYCYAFTNAQGNLFGHILSADETPLPGATIQLLEINRATVSDADGFFNFDNIEEGTYLLQIDYLGYSSFKKTIHIHGAMERDFTLVPTELEIEEVLIYGNWADEQTPMSFTNFKKEDIETNNLGQDVPYLLRWSPSVVVSSDAGTGIGYTGIRIRGTDPSRINVTINGIPLNDSESQSSFWVDLPDFLSSTESVQIQRGVGSSTNGAAAFGGTINLNTAKLANTPYATIASSLGSFNTQKYNVSLGSGLLENNLSFDARLSKISSDGYIDRASSDLKSYFVSAAYVGDKTSLRLNVFSGHEITYQAWNGVPAQYIDDDELRKTNTAGAEKSAEPHDNEVDDYTQTHYQLHYNQELAKNANLNIAFHYTKGLGFFEQYKAAQDLLDYNLTPDAGIEATDLIRRRWLDNDFYGTVFSLNVNSSSKMKATIGGGWNKYLGQHFGEVIWARFMSSGEQGQRYYDNDAQKIDFNIFAKMNYQLSSQLNTYLDLQYRNVDYTFFGFDNDGENLSQNVQLPFFNPKIGLLYHLKNKSNLYASFAVGNREPNRSDYTESTPDSRPAHETLYNTELGYKLNWKRNYFNINAYHMAYNNQLVLTGRINDVGEQTRVNVKDSYRLGLELDGAVNLSKFFSIGANATLSRNQIKSFREYIDSWDTGVQEIIQHENTMLAFSPNFIAGAELRYQALQKENQELSFSLLGKYVSKQFIDNTSNENTMLSAYGFLDLSVAYILKNAFAKEIGITLLVRNLTNNKFSTNAWTYRYISAGYDGRGDDPFTRLEEGNTYNLTGFYPQAGINFLLGLSMKF